MLKPLLNWLSLNVLPSVGASVIRLLRLTTTIEVKNQESVDALYCQGKHIILAFWHAQQLMVPVGYRGVGAHVLISQHRDGEIIARIISRFGFRAVRGSSTRGGALALRELIRIGRSGADLVVTPDGPKGPRQVAKLGVIQLAKATGMPIVPMAFSCSKKNSAQVGIDFSCPTHGGEGCLFGASRSGSRRPTRRKIWRGSVGSLNRCSIRSPMRLTR